MVRIAKQPERFSPPTKNKTISLLNHFSVSSLVIDICIEFSKTSRLFKTTFWPIWRQSVLFFLWGACEDTYCINFPLRQAVPDVNTTETGHKQPSSAGLTSPFLLVVSHKVELFYCLFIHLWERGQTCWYWIVQVSLDLHSMGWFYIISTNTRPLRMFNWQIDMAW